MSADTAPGAPGLPPTWSSSAKEMVGCSLGPSRLWFTVGGGILNEVYHPRVDIPQIRDLGIIVADGRGFWVEVKRMYRHTLTLAAPGVPAVRIVHEHERFELALRIAPSRERDVLLMEIELTGDESLRPYALLAPHLGGTGHNNSAAIAGHRGHRVLWAEQGPFALALAAVRPDQQDAWGRASCGFVGSSDGWQDFARNNAMTWEHANAGPGNVALLGELPREAVLALGFGTSTESAATLALSALFEPFEAVWQRQIEDWSAWYRAGALRPKLADGLPPECMSQFRVSIMALRAHLDKTYPGAMVASLSVPWGNTKEEREGYHLVWPRDLCESAGAFLAVGAIREALDTLRYLRATQLADGHWNQNQWLGGRPYWTGVQLDETAFPVLLAAQLEEHGALDGIEVGDMIRRALAFIVCNGPASDQDRWEEDAGINTFTLAACIAALVCGAPHLDPTARELALAVADYWNASLDAWTAVTDTPLCGRQALPGYYVRVAPKDALRDRGALQRVLPVKNQAVDPGLPAFAQIGVDFLQLVRFGLRRPDDPLIIGSVRLADMLLKVDTPSGPSWHRYNDDGYGEHDDGSAFDGTGRGRAWPLLTGERGHYEVAAGRDPLPLLLAMVRMASPGGMLPEQIWDAPPVPSRGLEPGRPTGSAMPLAWAHAEYIKLVVSRSLGRPFDRPERVWQRYGGRRQRLERVVWCAHAPASELPEGAALTVAVTAPATFRWGFDGWQDIHEERTTATPLGLHTVEIDTARLKSGRSIDLTYRLEPGEEWVGRDFRIAVVPADDAAQTPLAVDGQA
ncbi:MAG TPA: glycoside hydrolase family 15 protein [Steroidobacteraceae bacterium]|nr:glycoside hydrolase family 15 protein [Steroidobacteraceae bacterium]